MLKKVTLRDVDASDLPILFQNQLDPEAVRMAAFPSRDEAQFMAHWAKCLTDESAVLKTIEFQDQVAGSIVCWGEPDERKVGYWIGKEFWGQGVATAALAQLVELVRDRPLVAYVAKHNLGSIRVLEKCGFSVAGEDTYHEADGQTGPELIMMLNEPAQV